MAPPPANCTLETLHFDNLTLQQLPVHPDRSRLRTPQSVVSGACFSHAQPTPLSAPRLVVASPEALALLGLGPEQILRGDFAEYLGGNKLLPGAEPAAHCYCGHQFGHFSGQLGDGATMYLGEVLNSHGERWEIQFKGAGPTHYSRQADGRKVLRSSLREFLASEAMHALGIPTTRAGSLVTSDTRVARDLLYNGNVKHERASVLLRVARSFLRFGSFEICKPEDPLTGRAGPSVGQHHLIKALLEHVSTLLGTSHIEPPQARYLASFTEMVRRTAQLVARWQCVGFCHGVLNTDNMSVLGDTIDYGPFGFMEAYDPDHVCNLSDGGGRYAFKEQPGVCRWNCEKLAEALEPLLSREQSAEAVAQYDAIFNAAYLQGMRAKLGLSTEQPGDAQLVQQLHDTMQTTGADFTSSFRSLCSASCSGDTGAHKLVDKLLSRCAAPEQLAKALERRAQQAGPKIPKAQLLQLVHMAQRDPNILQIFGGPPEAVKAELQEELRKSEAAERLLTRSTLLRRMSANEKRAEDFNRWSKWLQAYLERLRIERDALGYAADDGDTFDAQRQRAMLSVNPRVVRYSILAASVATAAARLRFERSRASGPRDTLVQVLKNWIAQEAIDAAEAGKRFPAFRPMNWTMLAPPQRDTN